MNKPTPRTLFSQARLNLPRGKIIYRIVLTLVVVIFTLVFIGPLYFLFSDGLKSTTEAVQVPPTLIPAHVHPSTYASAWSRVGIGRLLFNTLYYAFGALFSQLIFDVTAAYSLSRLRPAGGKLIFALMLATLMIPSTVLLVPQYITVANLPILHLNLIGSPEAIWLPRWPTPSISSCSSGSSTRSRPNCCTRRRSTAPLRCARCARSSCRSPGRSSRWSRSSRWWPSGRTSSGRCWSNTAITRAGRR